MKTIFQTICLLLTLLTINLSVARSQTIDEAKTDHRVEIGPQAIPQILPGTSILIRLDLRRIELPEVIVKAIASGDSKTDTNVGQQIAFLQTKLDGLKELIGDEPMYVLVDMPLSPNQPIVRLAFPNRDEAIQKRIIEYLARFEIRTAPSQNGWLLASLSLYWPFDSTVQGRYFYSEVDETVELPLASAGSSNRSRKA